MRPPSNRVRSLVSYGSALRTTALVLPLLAAGLLAGCATRPSEPALTQEQKQLNVESFEFVWTTIRDKHFDPELGGLDWQAVHDELKPRVAQADKAGEARDVMKDMISRLEQTHFNILPADIYVELGKPAGEGSNDGDTGIVVRVLDGRAVVTTVDEGSPAAEAGVRPGWEIVEIDDEELDPILQKVSETFNESTTRELHLARSVRSRLRGPVGESVNLVLRDSRDRNVSLELDRIERKGNRIKLGHLGAHYVWFESELLQPNIGYFTFNAFMDPVRVMGGVQEAVTGFQDTDGIIIDLRGNPGGIGGMAGGVAGWFIDQDRLFMGTMITRKNELKFTVNPRSGAYKGPLVVLVDGLTASTSEIFAAGMKDLKRAQIIGSTSAGAALPSVIEKLPNGDGFQYAIANYVSTGGEALEGNGVSPNLEVRLTRESLLEGRDLPLEAAIQWIREQNEMTPSPESEPDEETVS